MHEKQKIDWIAHFSKELVDLFYTDENAKEYQKMSIDAMAEILKLYVDAQQAPILRIRAVAHRHHLERVTAFPYPVGNSYKFLFRMHGGEVSEFCAELGIPLLNEKTAKVNPILVDIMEQKHGIVLYDHTYR